MIKPKYHVFVCMSSRPNGQQKGFCHSKDAVGLLQAFIEEVEAQELQDEVLITGTGCFGLCTMGPVAVVYPDGVWYRELTAEDVGEIVQRHFIDGCRVERLEIK